MIEDPTLLSAHLDGELTDIEANAIELHLASCSECRDELDGLRAARAAVRGLPLLNPPAEVFENLLPRRSENEAEQSVRHRWLMPVAAAMVAVVVAVGVIAIPPTTDIPMHRLAVQHAAGSAAQPDVLLISVPIEGIAR
ncbi:MAG: zf-HC2 domain-containing protein [Acidimicrobiia bacterium]|nr:zf-HC2 domain-containing protein [Acidimicrobiia bacterium]NND13538.1 zf-HC2 domain-containing protein [Acidimicrobiia bacterium]